jgi:hypothetical protein
MVDSRRLTIKARNSCESLLSGCRGARGEYNVPSFDFPKSTTFAEAK